MSDHYDNCAKFNNAIDECDCDLGKIGQLEARVRELEANIERLQERDKAWIFSSTILQKDNGELNDRVRELEGQLQVEAEATAHLKEVIEEFNRGGNATMLAEVALAGLERVQKQKEGQ